jgi:hypothetical protein
MKTIILIATFFFLTSSGRLFLCVTSGKAPGSVYQSAADGPDTSRYVFVGAETCATKCHNNEEMGFQYDLWKKSSHSKAFGALSSDLALEYASKAGIQGNPSAAPACLKCHVTAAEAGPESISATYKMEDGITCEACHKGEFKPKTYLPKESDCLKCHNDSIHHVSPFDFDDRCKMISHPRPRMKKE